MTQPLVCHFLIGLPASGKSTFARKLQQIIPDAAIVSTDTARRELFGKEEIQGDWNEVESKVLEQIKNAIASNKPVIYDATNVRRDWRMGMLMKIEEKLKEIDAPQVYWVAWHLQTPVDVCKEWNQKRDRQVLDEIMDRFNEALKQSPLETGEGFIKIFKLSAPKYLISIKRKRQGITVTEEYNIDTINRLIGEELTVNNFVSSLQSKQNKQGRGQWHQYSKLLDFERLIYLISFILNNPGIDSLENICNSIQEKHGNIYADRAGISKDLDWLHHNYLIGECPRLNCKIELESIPDAELPCYVFSHSYSKKKSFVRLINTIRFISQNPVFINTKDLIFSIENKIEESSFIQEYQKNNLYSALEILEEEILDKEVEKLKTKKSKENDPKKVGKIQNKINYLLYDRTAGFPFPLRHALAFELLLHGIDITGEEKKSILDGNGKKLAKTISVFGSDFRKDIQKLLKPYQIMSEKTMSKGYFIGTAIFSKTELEDIYERMILPHKDYVDELVADEIYYQVETRIGSKAIDIQKQDPIRKIGISSIVDREFLPEESLARKNNLRIVEQAISNKSKLRLAYLKGSGKHNNEQHRDFEAYPLLILFHNIAWYLGLEYASGENVGLYKFERLDRLEFLDETEIKLDIADTKKIQQSLKNINKLYNSCPGIFLGNIEQQQKFLSSRAAAKTTIELWFTNEIFPFILEGIKRYSGVQMTDPRENPELNIPRIYTLQNQYQKAKYVHDLSDLSEHEKNERNRQLKLEKLFQLELTADKKFPNKFVVTFPVWSIGDYDFLRWILGFGGSVKVKQPQELVANICNLASNICQNYSD